MGRSDYKRAGALLRRREFVQVVADLGLGPGISSFGMNVWGVPGPRACGVGRRDLRFHELRG